MARRSRIGYASPAMRPWMRKKYIIGGSIVLAVVIALVILLAFTNVFSGGSEYPMIDAPDAKAVQSNSSGYFYMSGTTLVHTDFAGNEIWSSKFSSGALSLRVSDKLICVYDSESANVFDADKNLLFTIPNSNYKIESAYVTNDSIAMLTQLSSDDSVQYLRVFDSTGVEQDRIKLESTQILDYGLFGSDNNLWYLTLDATGVAPVSAITTENPAQKKVTGIVTISDQLIEHVYYFGTDMYAVGTTNITDYDSFGSKSSESLIYGMDCVDTCVTDKDIFFVFAPRNDQTSDYHSTARIISRGGVDTLIQLPDGITDMLVTATRIYAVSADKIYVYSLEGEYADTITPGFTIKDVTRTSADHALLTADDGIHSMKLK